MGEDTGDLDGVCAPLMAGATPTDDGTECAAEDATSCGRTGLCDGQGGCALFDATAECAPASCGSEGAAPAALCDGQGMCSATSATSCAPYVCDGDACATACEDNNGCVDGFVCEAGGCVEFVPEPEPEPVPEPVEEGCCAIVRPRSAPTSWLWLTLAALGLVLRRRVRRSER